MSARRCYILAIPNTLMVHLICPPSAPSNMGVHTRQTTRVHGKTITCSHLKALIVRKAPLCLPT